MEAEELKSPFEAIKQTDKNGKEWWNSRQLAKVMGYTKYWNFERLIDKVAHALQVERGLSRSEHLCEIEDDVDKRLEGTIGQIPVLQRP